MPILGRTAAVLSQTASPFNIRVYDKTLRRVGFIGDPTSLQVTVRHNGIGTASLVLPLGHRRAPDLMAKGARVVIDYDGRHLIGGPVRIVSGSRREGRLTFFIEDDWRLLTRILGWPVPGAAITAQTAAYDVRSGPAETVVKGFVTANATRLGLPVTAAPNMLRGATITVQMRMHPLADRLFPVVDQAGIGVTVRQTGTEQQGTGFLVDCYTPAVSPRVLTEASGVVADWGFSTAGMSVSDVVVGDQGEATARTFTSGTDATRRVDYGDRIEVFRDARDTNVPAVVAERIAEAMAEGAPRAGLKIVLAETATFRYGRAITVGDRAQIDIGLGEIYTDVLREAVINYTQGSGQDDGGLTVEPILGERTDDPSKQLINAVSRLGRDVRRLKSER